jgi:hypothetical protein
MPLVAGMRRNLHDRRPSCKRFLVEVRGIVGANVSRDPIRFPVRLGRSCVNHNLVASYGGYLAHRTGKVTQLDRASKP